MFKKLSSLKTITKIQTMILLITFLGVLILISFITNRTSRLNRDSAYQNAELTAAHFAGEIKSRLDLSMNTADALAAVLADYEKYESSQRRALFLICWNQNLTLILIFYLSG